MNCPNCAANNSNEALYCGHCAQPLTASALARQRSQEVREKRTREIELTEAVAERLMKWAKWFISISGAFVVLFGFVLGKGYFETQRAIEGGKAEIADAVKSGTSDIHQSIEAANSDIKNAKQELLGIGQEIGRLQSDVGKYQSVNVRIERLQADMLRLQNTVVDFGHKTLRAEMLEATGGPGGGFLSFNELGCSAVLEKAPEAKAAYCAQGTPAILNSMAPSGEKRPVASFSDIGFQDLSRSEKPICNEQRRGTIYIQKGKAHQSDVPFVCIKGTADTNSWLQLITGN
jgi:hypothetical protein